MYMQYTYSKLYIYIYIYIYIYRERERDLHIYIPEIRITHMRSYLHNYKSEVLDMFESIWKWGHHID